MFKKNEVYNGKIDTLIGANTKLIGKIEGKGVIRIDGNIEGDVIVDGNITLGTDGKVIGNIICNNIFISGTVKGNIKCKEQLRLSNTAKLYGDVEVKTLIIDENAIFEGKCKMENDSKAELDEEAVNN